MDSWLGFDISKFPIDIALDETKAFQLAQEYNKKLKCTKMI